MSESTDAYDALLRGMEALDEGRRDARRLIDEAREAYAPASLAPQAGETPPERSRLGPWLLVAAPDRLVTYPIWAMGVAVSHLFLLLVLLGVVVSGGALAIFVARILDVVIGFPLASPPAWAIAALASAGTFVTVFQSFKAKLGQFPW